MSAPCEDVDECLRTPARSVQWRIMNIKRRMQGSFWGSMLVGALGAFIFWGVLFSGWFNGDETKTQVAAPVVQDAVGN